ncbi:FAD-dependent oxidoreductase [Luteimonas huabeiensis]|uniref:FAD-dependent oxidoreductase n=1 Tax=Luteimonas huabeiensis TaxID=1244513 RepID=UPI0004655ED4|nr:FAD-dependent oxidoreductase [Luteimonas huabeiensis]
MLGRLRAQAKGVGATIASDQRIGIYGPARGLLGHARFLRSYSAHVALLPADRAPGRHALREARALGMAVLPAGGALAFDGVRCRYRAPDGTEAVFDTVYPYLGYAGRNTLLRGLGLPAEDDGALRVDRHQRTRVPGLYAIGDVVSGLNQIAVAVGQAAVAATHAHNALPFAPRA